MPLKLLVFAHRGEASAFFKEWAFTPVEFYFAGLFKSSEHYLLITGEGLKEASEKTVAVLSKFKEDIGALYNIGIAGSLSARLSVGDTVWVRSSYAQGIKGPEFKSYTSPYHTGIDCISSSFRVMDIEDKKTLSSFADIVDRELWAVASAAHLFKLPAFALKLISDDMNSTEMCQLIKEDAPRISRELLEHYLKHLAERESKEVPLPAQLPAQTLLDFLLLHPKFYFTTTQTRKLSQTLRGLELKKVVSPEEIKHFAKAVVESHSEEKTPKELGKIFLALMEDKLHPLKARIREKIALELKTLTESGASVSFDPELEVCDLHLHMHLKNAKDQKRLMLALEQFHYQKIKDIFAGKIEDDV